jgi:ABC-type Zn uptake system ZnuABC Zn-binding protein ZnuA
MLRKISIVCFLLITASLLPGLLQAQDRDKPLEAVATLFPTYDFSKQIGGHRVHVTLLLPPGVESHTYEPKPSDVARISKADVFIYTGEFMEPWAKDLLAGMNPGQPLAVNTSKNIELMKETDHTNAHGNAEAEDGKGHPFEWAGVFELKKGVYRWSFAAVDGAYADPAIRMAVLKTSSGDKEGIKAVEKKAGDLFDSYPRLKKDGETIPVGGMLHYIEFDASKAATSVMIDIPEDGVYVFFTEHMPYEFEGKEHFFKDAAGADVEPAAEEPAVSAHHHHHGGKDPHIWTDLANCQKMVDTIAGSFCEKDAANCDFYKANAEAYKAKLADLDQRFLTGLASCKHKTIIYGGHFAFGYFAARYGLDHISPYRGFSPDAEPTPKALAELIKTMRESGMKYIYYEELLDPKVARVIAEETGAKLELLHGAHNVSKDDLARGLTFLEIMEENLAKLKTGLECS